MPTAVGPTGPTRYHTPQKWPEKAGITFKQAVLGKEDMSSGHVESEACGWCCVPSRNNTRVWGPWSGSWWVWAPLTITHSHHWKALASHQTKNSTSDCVHEPAAWQG